MNKWRYGPLTPPLFNKSETLVVILGLMFISAASWREIYVSEQEGGDSSSLHHPLFTSSFPSSLYSVIFWRSTVKNEREKRGNVLSCYLKRTCTSRKRINTNDKRKKLIFTLSHFVLHNNFPRDKRNKKPLLLKFKC